MKGLAGKGKTSVGWFYGLKLHLIVNQYGQLCNFMITPGHVSDNNSKVLQTLFKNLQGIFFGSKGYLTRQKQALADKGVKLITKVRRNMKKVLYSAQEKYFLKKRGIIETVFGLLSFQADIDHTGYRSQSGMFINLLSGLAAYTYFDSLPAVKDFTPLTEIEFFQYLIA